MSKKRVTFKDLEQQRQRLREQEEILLQKSLSSTNIIDLQKAKQYITNNIVEREQTNSKSLLIDPLQVISSLGYREKLYSINYDMLRNMSRVHVIKSIIETRKEQVLSFCVPQKDKYSTGFVIERATSNYFNKDEKAFTKQEEKEIEELITFILNCGSIENTWHGDSFDVFIAKWVTDSLTYDQACYENVRDNGGDIIEFLAVDSSTIRIADSYDDNQTNQIFEKEKIKNYTPSYVQIYQGRKIAEFYPWEMCFGVRNPQTDLRQNGYGRSELEDMIHTITALLNSDKYNSNFFKVGSAPKGILKYTGNINPTVVEDFKKQWVAQISGVDNMHKTPMINADKLDFISTHIPNKDMEFSKYQEFLIKISCAMYKIDPSEIGFPMNGSTESKPMFEGNNEARLKYSKDKGLKPLLIKLQSWFNKYTVSQKYGGKYRLRFVGIDSEKGEIEELDRDIKLLSNFMTIDEIRARWNLKDMPDDLGKIINNPTFYQNMVQKEMAKQQNEQGQDPEQFYNQFDNDSENVDEGDDDPFIKSLSKSLPEILSEPAK